MNNIDVIQLALDKAHQEGYRIKELLTKVYTEVKATQFDEKTGQITVAVRGKSGKEKLQLNIRQLLFDVPFARALFGTFWETHLNLMSSTADHLHYLELYLTQHHQ